jgi:hypothetical protein
MHDPCQHPSIILTLPLDTAFRLAQDNGTNLTSRSQVMKHALLSIALSIAASVGGTLLLRAVMSTTGGPPEPASDGNLPRIQNNNNIVVVIPIAIGGNIAGGGNTWKGFRRGRRRWLR